MPSDYIGKNRSTAVYQIIGLVYLFTIFPVVLTIGLVGGLVYMVLDVITKLIMNRPGGNGKLSGFGMRLFKWPIVQLEWIATGSGDFQFLP